MGGSSLKHKHRTREALGHWFRQSERLNIARKQCGLRGDRFGQFANRIETDRGSAFQLVQPASVSRGDPVTMSGEAARAVGLSLVRLGIALSCVLSNRNGTKSS